MPHAPRARLSVVAAAISAAVLGVTAVGVTAISVAAVGVAAPAAAATTPLAADGDRAVADHLRASVASPVSGDSSLSPVERALNSRGYLVPDPKAYARAKAGATKEPTASGPAVAVASDPPRQVRSFEGVRTLTSSPSDSTGAIGTDRYIELVNVKYGIYDRRGSLLGKGSLNDLVGAGAGDNVFDPQVIWDPGTRRFYFAADQITAGGNNILAVGFSKGPTPNGPNAFCTYSLRYGSRYFPDYPKLGDTKQFTVLGVNVFDNATGGSYVGSDILTMDKPPAGTACPDRSSLSVTQKTDVRQAGGQRALTPVPANQTDTAAAGYVVASSANLPADELTLFKVTRNRNTGDAVIGAGTRVAVPSYDVPANAPQLGTSKVIDTSDTRLTQAVSAVDPVRGGGVGLWTQHTVAGGAGAQVRWYEIRPTTATTLQRGVVGDPALYAFNGAVSPDRKVDGAVHKYGGNMVLNYNTSSATSYPTIQAVSKVGNDAQSPPSLVASSLGPDIDFTCNGTDNVCRWGDYAAATPDPGAPTRPRTGLVWGTNQYNEDGRLDPNKANWLTRNFAFHP